MSRLVSKAELAREAGVTAAAITKAIKGKLAPALVGNRIDRDHPSVVRYLARREEPEPEPPRQSPVEAAARGSTTAPSDSGGMRSVVHEIENIEEVADMTIRQVVTRFGSTTSFKDWLDALKQIEEIRERRLKNERADGTVIPREPVQTFVFGAMDAVNRRLLADSPKTIARRLHGLVKSGGTVEDCEKAVRDIISSQIRPVKDQAARILRDG